MSAKQLQERWKSGAGRALAGEVLEFLRGARRQLPGGVGSYAGRADLRGLSLPAPARGAGVAAGAVSAETMSGIIEFRDVRWQGLDLSQARLASLRFFGSVIEGCRFDGAACRDWRLWATEVKSTSFDGADLRDAAIGTWHEGRANSWSSVSFDGADLRGALALGCLLEGCSFRGSRLAGSEFQQVSMRHCQFAGAMKDVLFDGRELPGKPEPGVFVGVDFSDATFEDVEFRGCRFDGVKLPPGVYVVPAFPRVARNVLDLLVQDETVEGRMLRAELNLALKLPGAEDSVAVFNRRDYLASGGERLADLAESLLMEAASDNSH